MRRAHGRRVPYRRASARRCVGAQIRSAHIRAEVMSNCVSLQKAHEPPATNGRMRPTVVDRPRGATTADRPVSE